MPRVEAAARPAQMTGEEAVEARTQRVGAAGAETRQGVGEVGDQMSPEWGLVVEEMMLVDQPLVEWMPSL